MFDVKGTELNAEKGLVTKCFREIKFILSFSDNFVKRFYNIFTINKRKTLSDAALRVIALDLYRFFRESQAHKQRAVHFLHGA